MAKVIAKGKIKRHEAEVQKELEDNIVVPVGATKEINQPGRREISSGEIVNIMADEIEAIYADYHAELDRPNAEDKALNIVRHLRYKAGVKFSEIPT